MSASTEYKYIDPEMLQELANGDQEFISEMINIFLEDVPDSLKKMNEAMKASDLQTVARQAHKLKPSSGMIGAEITTSLASQIEEIANNNDPDQQLVDLLESLSSALDSCYAELSLYRSQLSK